MGTEEQMDGVSRREMLQGAAAASALLAAGAGTGQAYAAAAGPPMLDLAEYSYQYIGVETAATARGPIVDGRCIYVEYFVPRQLRRPYPIILVHGGTGQGLDWMSTPDGRPGWVNHLLSEGYAVYVVDRQGQGRNPYWPVLHGEFSARPPNYEDAVLKVANLKKDTANPYGRLHTQWPGTGEIGDKALDQFVSGRGQAVSDPVQAEDVWRSRAAMLLERTGPAILVTHGDSSGFAWLAADAKPDLVKGIVTLEPDGPGFRTQVTMQGAAAVVTLVQPLPWGLTRTKITYDPPAAAPGDLKTVEQNGFRLQAEPARKLVNLAKAPIVVVTAEASAANGRDPGVVALLKQAGCDAEQLKLADQGVRGNGPFPMLEKNNREALAPILAWLDRKVAPALAQPRTAPAADRSNADSSAVKVADIGNFFVGVQKAKVDGVTVATAQTHVQYLIPAELKHRTPIIMIHGGIGQWTHMTGIGGRPGWAHFFLREGYPVYIIDRPSFGRVPVDTFDSRNLTMRTTAIGGQLVPSPIMPGPKPGFGLYGEDLQLQFTALEGVAPPSMAHHSEQFTRGMTELLDRIGPSVLFTHAWSGSLGWAVADRRPNLVKAMITLESNNAPFEGEVVWGLSAIPLTFDPPAAKPQDLKLANWTPPPGALGDARPFKVQAEPARKLKNLASIPTLWVINSPSRYSGPAQVQFLKQAGVPVEYMDLGEHGVRNQTNLVLLQKMNWEAFTPLRDWLAKKGVDGRVA